MLKTDWYMNVITCRPLHTRTFFKVFTVTVSTKPVVEMSKMMLCVSTSKVLSFRSSP